MKISVCVPRGLHPNCSCWKIKNKVGVSHTAGLLSLAEHNKDANNKINVSFSLTAVN